MSLALLQPPGRTDSAVLRTRNKIGVGLVLSRESTGVWIYNRSRHPVFVNCLRAESLSSRDGDAKTLAGIFPANIHKLPPGFSQQIFDYEFCRKSVGGNAREGGANVGPFNPYSVQISFAKGWGSNYTRQTIMLCPCWIEILLNVDDL